MRAPFLVVLVLLACACGESQPLEHDQGPPVVTEPPPPAVAPGEPQGDWLNGDLHVHDDHSSDGSFLRQCCDQQGPGNNPPSAQIGFAELIGLRYLPLTDHRTFDQHYDPLWESSRLLLIHGEEANGSPHATVHGATDTIVQGANPPDQPDFVNLQQSIWQAHSEDANWVTSHPDDGETNEDGSPNARASAIGIDLIEVWNKSGDIDAEMAYAEARWNAGFRTGVAGASDDHFIELWALTGPGSPTTWVFAPARTERALVGALRAGRTSVSSDQFSPLLTLQGDLDGDGVFESMGGDEAFVPAGTQGTLRVRIRNGLGATVSVFKSPGLGAPAIATFSPSLLEADASFDVPVTAEEQPAWYRASARGLGLPDRYDISNIPLSLVPNPVELPDQLRAVTSPIFVSPAPVSPVAEIPLPADSGTEDGATLALGRSGEFMGFPDAAGGGDVLHVVAERHIAGGSRIIYRRRSGLDWAAEVELSPENASARYPKVAARGNDVWVVWQDERNGELPHRSAIYLRHSGDGGATWESETKVRSAGGRCEHPALAVTLAGAPVVAWQEIASGRPFDVMVSVGGSAPVNLSGDGKQVQAASLIDARSSRYPASVWPALAVADDGRVAIAWQDDRTDPDPLWTGQTLVGDGTDPDNWQIMVRVAEAGATGWSPPSSVGADDRADRHPAIAFDGGGALQVIWDSKVLDASGANLSVLTARSADGATFSDPVAIALDEAAMSTYPKLARGSDGSLRAAWHDSRSADWRWRVMTAKQAEGGAWGAGEMLPSRGINTWPSLAGDALVFASTRNAQRLQRDRTQQIFAIALP